MCLIVKNPKENIATEDIICYKVLNINLLSGELTTGVRDSFVAKMMDVKYPIEYCASGNKKITQEYGVYGGMPPKIIIEGGYIHTFKNAFDASCFISLNKYHDNIKPLVYKCIIPKDTVYYEGAYEIYNNNGYDAAGYYNQRLMAGSYCSEKIIITEIRSDIYCTREEFIKYLKINEC